MKPQRTIISCFLTLLILFFAATPAFAAPLLTTESVTPPKPDGAVVFPEDASDSIDWEGLTDDMWNLLFTGEKRSINISRYHIPVSADNKNAIFFPCWYEPRFLRTAPVGLSKDDTGKYYETLNNLDTTKVTATDPAENRVKFDACADAVSQLTYGIKGNDSISQADKALLLHDRLVSWTEYDYDGYYNGTLPDDSPDYTAYGPLVNRLGVCNGYALAYNWLLQDVGMEAWYENSGVINHGWSKVKVDGELYYVDPTWDDPLFDTPGLVLHEYFLQSYPTFSSNHDAYDFDESVTSTRFEDYFSKEIRTDIIRWNGADYYFNKNAALIRRDTDGTETRLLQLQRFFVDGTTLYYPSPKLTIIGDKLLYLTPKTVRAYDLNTGDDTLVYEATENILKSSSYFLNGLKQVDGVISVTSTDQAQGSFDENTVAQNTESFSYCTHPVWEPLTNATQKVRFICPACRALCANHSFTKQTVSEDALHAAATCSAPATYYYSCAVCGAIERDAAHTFTDGEPVAHSYTAQTVSDAALKATATCTDPATYYYSCAVCGAVEQNDSHTFTDGEALGHNWQWKIDTEATCAAAGVKHEACIRCNATRSENTTIAPTGEHGYTAQTVSDAALKAAATCTAPATYYYSCTVCGAVEQNDSHTFTDGEALGHDWQWVIDTEATCATAGSKHEACTRCDATRSENTAIAPTGAHSYTALTVSDAALKTAASCTAPATYYYSCTICGAVEQNDSHTFTDGAALGHNWKWVIETEATCAAAGVKHEACTRCDATRSENTAIAPTGAHSYTALTVSDAALKAAATCTVPATYYYSCTVCGAVEKNDSHTFASGVALGHDWKWVIETEATCATAGSKHEACTRCDATRSENTAIAPTGMHSYTAQTVNDAALKAAATCTTPATYYYSCDVCGAVEQNDSHTFTEGEALGHNWQWAIDTEATCAAAGVKHEACTRCDATRSENTAIDPTGAHSYTAQTVSDAALKAAATCTVPATYYYSCTVCGAVEKNDSHTFASGVALGHDWRETARVNASCTKTGSVTYTCTHDSTHGRTETLPTVDHADNSGDGYCDSCGKDLRENRCPYCGQVHTGFFGLIVGFFHRILALFKR